MGGVGFSPRNVPPGVDFYVDLMRVSKSASGWRLSVEKLFANEADLQSYSGTHRFSLMVTADNAKPASCMVDVTYNKDWHDISAVQVL